MNSTAPHKPDSGKLVNVSGKARDALLKMTAESEGSKLRIILAGYG